MSHLPVKVRDQSDLVSPVGYVSQRSKVRSLVNLNSNNFHQYLSKMFYNLIYRFMSLFCLFYCFKRPFLWILIVEILSLVSLYSFIIPATPFQVLLLFLYYWNSCFYILHFCIAETPFPWSLIFYFLFALLIMIFHWYFIIIPYCFFCCYNFSFPATVLLLLKNPPSNFSHRSLLRFFPLWLIMQILSFNFVVVKYIYIKKASPNTVLGKSCESEQSFQKCPQSSNDRYKYWENNSYWSQRRSSISLHGTLFSYS